MYVKRADGVGEGGGAEERFCGAEPAFCAAGSPAVDTPALGRPTRRNNWCLCLEQILYTNL